jgi:hypothetical protein
MRSPTLRKSPKRELVSGLKLRIRKRCRQSTNSFVFRSPIIARKILYKYKNRVAYARILRVFVPSGIIVQESLTCKNHTRNEWRSRKQSIDGNPLKERSI